MLFLHAISGTWLPAEMQKMSSYSRFRSWQPPADLLNLLRQACYFFAFEDPPPAALMDCLNAAAKSVSSFTTLVGAAMCDSRPNQASSSAGSATVKRPSFLTGIPSRPALRRGRRQTQEGANGGPALQCATIVFRFRRALLLFLCAHSGPFSPSQDLKNLAKNIPGDPRFCFFRSPITRFPDQQITRFPDQQISRFSPRLPAFAVGVWPSNLGDPVPPGCLQ